MDKNIDFSNQMELEHILGDIDLNEDAPVSEGISALSRLLHRWKNRQDSIILLQRHGNISQKFPRS